MTLRMSSSPTRSATTAGTKAAMILAWFAGILLVAAVVTRTFFIGYYHIPQNGMYPGMPKGSKLFTVKRAYADSSSVRRGDVVVFVREDNGQRYNYIWRVIALPGERVEASGEALAIDGHAVLRQRIREVDGAVIFREQIGDAAYEVAFDRVPKYQPPDVSITIPPGQFFVMGDNRYAASDSRDFGPIAFGSIIGRKL